MKTPLQLAALAVWCLATTAAAQDPATPVSDALRTMAKRSATNLTAAAEEMPAGKYGFKPTPAQMSVGDIVAHLSEGNDFLCSKIGGVEAPKRPEMAKGAPKEKLLAPLRGTFEFWESALAQVDDPKLGGEGPFFLGHEMVPAGAVVLT